MEFNAPHAGGPGIGGGMTLGKEVIERLKGLLNAVKVGLFTGEEAFKGGDGVSKERNAEAIMGVSEKVCDQVNPLGMSVGEVGRQWPGLSRW